MILPYRAITGLLKRPCLSSPYLILSSLQRKAPTHSHSSSFSVSCSHIIYPYWKDNSCSFPFPNPTSLSLLQEEARQGWGTWEGPLRQNWSTRGVCVKAGVRSSGQGTGRLGWAGLGVEGALQPVWLLPSSNSHPSHSKFCSHILEAPNINFL